MKNITQVKIEKQSNYEKDHWIKVVDDEYHKKQFMSPYRSTEVFVEYMEELNLI